MQKIQIVLFTAILCLAAYSCKLDSKNLRSGGAGAVLDTSFVYIERTPNRTEAIVRFRTKVPAQCHIKFWSDTVGNGKDSAINQDCANTEPKRDFSEVIKPLSPTDFYTVEIAVWGRAGAFDRAEKFTVREGENAVDKNDLFVARVNLQLRTTEVHRHRLGAPADSSVLSKVVETSFGCQKDLSAQIPFHAAEQMFKAESLSFRGFATGESSAHKLNSSFRRVRFNTIAPSNEWEWTFTVLGQSFSFNLNPASLFSKVIVSDQESNSIEIRDSQLTVNPREILSRTGSGDLKITWTMDNPSDSSYVLVQLGNPGSSDSITCVFDPKTGSGLIAKEEIAKLGKKNHDLLVGVVSYQLDLSNQQQSKPAWLVETTDWKLGTLAVQ